MVTALKIISIILNPVVSSGYRYLIGDSSADGDSIFIMLLHALLPNSLASLPESESISSRVSPL